MIDLLVSLHRHENTAATALEQMTPRELSALELRTDLVRNTIPRYVLQHYELVKQTEPVLGECPAALAMATLVSVYRALPRQKRRAMTSFFDLAQSRTAGRASAFHKRSV